MFKSQIGSLASDRQSGPKSPKRTRNGFRMVARTRDSPSHFLASGNCPTVQNLPNKAQTPDQPPLAAATGIVIKFGRLICVWQCAIKNVPNHR